MHRKSGEEERWGKDRRAKAGVASILWYQEGDVGKEKDCFGKPDKKTNKRAALTILLTVGDQM